MKFFKLFHEIKIKKTITRLQKLKDSFEKMNTSMESYRQYIDHFNFHMFLHKFLMKGK